VRAGHPLGATDRIALDQAVDDLDSAGERYAVHGARLQFDYGCDCTVIVPTVKEKLDFVRTMTSHSVGVLAGRRICEDQHH
jgi:hypothetical protein